MLAPCAWLNPGYRDVDSDLYGGGNSAISTKPADYSAFDARDALYNIQYYGTIPPLSSKTEGVEFVQGMKQAVEQASPGIFFKEYGAS